MNITATKNNGMYLSIILVLLVILPLVYALQFSSNPEINEGGTVRTEDDLNCSWQSGGDEMLPTNITWYKNGVEDITLTSSDGTSILLAANTSKDETWICEVFLGNATDEISANASVVVTNSLPRNIELNNGSQIIFDGYQVTEDGTYTFFINATDPDLDNLTYGITNPTICTIVNSVTGEINCNPDHEDLTGTASPAVEPASNSVQAWPYAFDSSGGPTLFFNFTVLPVNDQASFDEIVQNHSVEAGETWVYQINATDEELDHDLIYTFYTDINDVFPNLIFMEKVDSNSINLTFNTSDNSPNNLHVGNWTFYVNVTDANGSNTTREPDEFVFRITITTINHVPTFTTNLSNTTGNQSLSYEAYIFANDTDIGDNLTFGVNNVTGYSDNCVDSFPWSISTINSSPINASGLINITLINNSFVACRYINITVEDDTGVKDAYITFINLTNINDAPVLQELSVDGNISSQQTYMFVGYSYTVNAIDVDNYTYDRDNTANLTYYINESSPFSIGLTSGVFSATITNESHIGNWTINVTVSDGEYNDTRFLNLEVFNNSAPLLNLSNNNVYLNQSDLINVSFSGIEYNNDSMFVTLVNLSNYNLSIYSVEYDGSNYSNGYNESFWVLNLSYSSQAQANSFVGTHQVKVILEDSIGASTENVSTGTLWLTVLNENDAPIFDQDEDNFSDAISLGVVVENLSYNTSIYATDYDLYLGNSGENLSFYYYNASSELVNFSFIKYSDNEAYLSFVPIINNTLSVILMVNDTNGSATYQNVSFEVLSLSTDPNLIQVRPHYNYSTNQTGFGFENASIYPNRNVTVNVTENTSVVFDAIISNDTSVVNNNLTYYWYFDGELNQTNINTSPGVNSFLNISFDFFSSGMHNVTLIAEDLRLSSVNFTWNINVTNLNRPPIYYGTLDELTVNTSTTFPNYFSYRNAVQRFYDPDEDLNNDGIRTKDLGENTSLRYTLNNADQCSLATFSISGDDLTIDPIETGFCAIIFNATDPYNESVITGSVTITVTGGQANSVSETQASSSGGSSTRTQVITVPYEQEVDVPTPLDIVVPKNVDVYVNKTIKIPIVLKNSWTDPLKGVYLNVTLDEDLNVTYDFTRDYISEIGIGQEVETILILTNYRVEGPFEVTVNAKVTSPPFVDSAGIFINSLEQSSEGEAVRTKVTFARDMISENSECRELNDLLDRAEMAMNNLDFPEALNLVNAVINGCKYLINKDEFVRKETPTIIEVAFDFMSENADKIAIGAALLTGLTILAYAIVGVKKIIDDTNRRNEKDKENSK